MRTINPPCATHFLSEQTGLLPRQPPAACARRASWSSWSWQQKKEDTEKSCCLAPSPYGPWRRRGRAPEKGLLLLFQRVQFLRRAYFRLHKDELDSRGRYSRPYCWQLPLPARPAAACRSSALWRCWCVPCVFRVQGESSARVPVQAGSNRQHKKKR